MYNQTEYMRKYREENRNKIREKSREYSKRFYEKNKQACNRASLNARFKRRFGLTIEQRDAMIQAQRNQCKLCSRPFTSINRACVDHDHVTGKVRGILCTECNQALGLFHDNVKTLWRVMNYLRS